MENCWPALPIQEGVQTNCWKFATVSSIVNAVLQFITNLVTYEGATIFQDLLNIFFTIMYQYHSLYYTISITEEMIEIKGGPCQWCAEWNNKEDIKHWCSASWCFSSQVTKAEIVAIERRRAEIWPDYFPRYYCSPIDWCCCHKSYNGWYFPCCCECCEGVQACDCCIGDVYPVCGNEYITIHLSESPTACLFPQRCTVNLWFSCCTYNRISYVLRDPSVVDQLKQCGYQVLELAPGGTTGTAAGGQATDTSGNNPGGTDTGAAA